MNSFKVKLLTLFILFLTGCEKEIVTSESPVVMKPPVQPIKEAEPQKVPHLTLNEFLAQEAVDKNEVKQEKAQAESQILKVGVLLPLSGQYSEIGQSMLRAAELALFDMKPRGMTLYPYDTKGTAHGAYEALKLAVREGVSIVIGPVFSHEVDSISTLARNENIYVLSFSTDASVAAPGVYITGFLPDQHLTRILHYAIAQGHQKLAAILPKTPYGKLLAKTLQAVTEQREVSKPFIVYYENPSPEALSGVVQMMAKEMPEDITAILVPDEARDLQALLPLLPFYDINTLEIKLIGINSWQIKEKSKDPYLRQAWFSSPPLSKQGTFIMNFKEAFGVEPLPLAALAYDCVSITSYVSNYYHGPKYKRKIGELLTKANGFSGSTGVFRLLPSGLNQRRFEVVQITAHGAFTVSPAASGFNITQQN